ncbi:MAG: hypothetical protein AAF918_20370 [Pseudomonadota bacterium]
MPEKEGNYACYRTTGGLGGWYELGNPYRFSDVQKLADGLQQSLTVVSVYADGWVHPTPTTQEGTEE